MAYRDLVIFNRAYQGINNTVRNLASIRAARANLEQEKEIRDLDIKQKKIDIEKSTMQNNSTKMEQEFLQSQLKQLEGIAKADTKAKEGKIDIAEMTEKQKLGQLGNVVNMAGSRLDDNDMAQLMGMSGGGQQPDYSNVARNLNGNLPEVSYSKNIGGFNIKMGGNKKNEVIASDKVLGSLQQGGFVDEGGRVSKFKNREQAEAFASSKLGPDYQKRFPRAKEFIDKSFPPPDEFGFKVGETRTVKRAFGQDEYEYIGENKWKKVER